MNLHRFQFENEVLHTTVGLLLTDATVYAFLRFHPHTAPSTWPGEINLCGILIMYSVLAWKTAQQSGVLAYIPQSEVKWLDELY